MSGKAEALAIECPYCRALPTIGCRSIPHYRGPMDAWTDWHEREAHTARVRAAEKAREEKG